MAKVPGLQRKKSAYFYIRRIPSDIRALFANRQQLTVPLNTTDYRVASERARAKATEVDKQFQNARLGIISAVDAICKVSRQRLEQAVRLHLYDEEKKAETRPRNDDDARYFEDYLGILETPSEEAWGGDTHMRALKIAAKFRLAIAPGDQLWLTFILLVHRAEIEHARRSLNRVKTIYGSSVHDEFFGDVSAAKPPPKLLGGSGSTVRELIARFESDPLRADLTASAGKKYLIPFAVLREVAGDDFPVKEINRSQCAEMIEIVAALPPNYTKNRKFKGKALREIGELAQSGGAKRLSAGTVEVYAHHLSAFFNYAIQKGIIETNPASRLVPKSAKTANGRVPFDAAELNRLVAALPAWSGTWAGGRFWLPLIALFSGMRLGEIIWLKRGDVRSVDGVIAFVLEPTDDRSLKTKGAARVVPVHPALVQVGLTAFLSRLKHPSERLFADLPGETQQHAVDLFQKRFSYWVGKQLKVRDGVSFHSFRHCFRDATRNAGIPIDAIRALGGWGRGGAIEERYGQGTRPSVLADWMAKITYPDVDFSQIIIFETGCKTVAAD